MKIHELNESTTSGSIAPVSAPMTGTIKRGTGVYPSKKGGNLLTGKKTKKPYANSLSEAPDLKSKQQCIDYFVSRAKQKGEDLNTAKRKGAAAWERGYRGGATQQSSKKKSDSGQESWTNRWEREKDSREEKLSEDDLREDDIIHVPGQVQRIKSGFIPHEQDRRDHEVEMARGDLYQAHKNAAMIHALIKDVTEDQGLEGWVQAKITKAADYLNSVRQYLEGKHVQESAGVIAGGGVGESKGDGGYGPHSRGVADGYYGRKADPHKMVTKDEKRERVKLTDPKEIKQYMDGYKDDSFGRKDYGVKESSVNNIPDKDDPANILSKKQLPNFITRQMMSVLTPREERIIRMRFFLDMTYREIGDKLGVSGGRIQQIEQKAIRRMKHPSNGFAQLPRGGKYNTIQDRANDFMDVDEGKKVDRMVKHIAKSEREAGKSKKDAESIAWATANKRGYLDNRNKKESD
jgi:RNA polymerase sigma factor (sigma-70 family)